MISSYKWSKVCIFLQITPKQIDIERFEYLENMNQRICSHFGFVYRKRIFCCIDLSHLYVDDPKLSHLSYPTSPPLFCAATTLKSRITTQQICMFAYRHPGPLQRGRGGVLGNPVASRDLSPYRSTPLTGHVRSRNPH